MEKVAFCLGSQEFMTAIQVPVFYGISLPPNVHPSTTPPLLTELPGNPLLYNLQLAASLLVGKIWLKSFMVGEQQAAHTTCLLPTSIKQLLAKTDLWQSLQC